MKRICKAVAGMLAAVFMGQAVLAAPLLGDVNGDGSVTAKDKMTLARYVDGWEGYSIDEDAGDIDRDGDADAEDAEQLGRYFAGYKDDWGIGEAADYPTGFSVNPVVTSNDAVTMIPAIEGTVYYYYLKNNAVPDKDDFINFWNVGYGCGSVSVHAECSAEVSLKAGSYPYMAVCLYDGEKYYLPVVLCVDFDTDSGEKVWENPFTDVYKSATYYKSIQFVYENGLFSGMSATKFEPDTTMTRAMFITVLGRPAGLQAEDAERYGIASAFTDVDIDDASIAYAVPYINWAVTHGVIDTIDGEFAPKDAVTHAQMYIWIRNYAACIENLDTDATGTNIPANDVLDIPEEAYTAVEYAAKNNFLITSSNRITPTAFAKRSELAMLLHRFCVNVLEWKE